MKRLLKPCLGLSFCVLLFAASCEKKSTSPSIEQINSCVECGGFDADYEVYKAQKAKVGYDSTRKEWIIILDTGYRILLPCKFPKELLTLNKEFIFDGRGKTSEYRIPYATGICIEKIY